jgi:PAS domain S-box-containing protein
LEFRRIGSLVGAGFRQRRRGDPMCVGQWPLMEPIEPVQNPDLDASADFRRLIQAFDVFNQASESLQQSYNELQGEAHRLAAELAAANAELERSLAEKESFRNYLKNILESLSNGVLVVDREARAVVCNPAAGALLCLSPDDVRLARSYRELAIPASLQEFIAAARSAGVPPTEAELHWNNAAGQPQFLSVSASPVSDPHGQNAGVTIVLKDITRLKELEIQTQRARQLQAMGEMAVQLAHEIRNPLGSIELFASLLGNELRGQEDFKGWADQIVAGVKFLNNIVTNMLTFSRDSQPQSKPLDLRGLILETLAFVDPVLQQRKIRLEQPAATGDALLCMGDHGMLRQMFLNLFMNALQAMPESGWLAVRVEPDHQGTVRVEVEDSGIGIPAEHLGRIFDPFFTTHAKGTGLGLALVHQIVHQHQGRIEAHSEFGKGTRFAIWLPAGQGTENDEGRSSSVEVRGSNVEVRSSNVEVRGSSRLEEDKGLRIRD